MADLTPGDPEERPHPDPGHAPDAEAESTIEAPLRVPRGETIRFGPYRVFEQIGSGGMGEVYAAEQVAPLRRRVAIKLIKLGMDTEAVVARFEAERQALAMMEHPNIAKAYDAGVSPTGRPYFVMELVLGAPITRYCDEHCLTIRERLDLFLDVCRGVQHAHQKGVIHRDLKPSNVLVTLVDGRPVPKVIDFGIAKAVGHRLTDKTIHTSLGQLIGTPEYMSPEQAASETDVDTRSDIYSLGVILYELLTGMLPLESASLRSPAPGVAQRAIRGGEPGRPSRKLAALATGRPSGRTSGKGASGAGAGPPGGPGEVPTIDEIARRRRTDPAHLRRLIRGDLDWITMRCLEKDPARRYETANGLASDLVLHMNDQAVLAGPPSASYRLAKFARRNRLFIAASAAVLFALVVGLGLATYGLVDARRQRDAARRSEAKAAAVNAFLQDMLASVNPSKALGREVTVRQAVDEAAHKLDAGTLQDQPEIEIAVRTTMGKTYQALGDYATAEKQLRTALHIARSKFGEVDPHVAEGQAWLASVLYDEGRSAAAESLSRASLVLPRPSGLAGHDLFVRNLNLLAMIAKDGGRLGEADSLFRRILEIEQEVRHPGDPYIATSLSNLGSVLERRGQLAAAESLLRRALAIDTLAYGREHPEIATDFGKLADILEERGDLDGAEALYRRALAMRRRFLESDHPSVAVTAFNLAHVLMKKGATAEAAALYRETVAIDRKALGPGADLALDLQILGRSLDAMGNHTDAEAAFREALTLRRQYLGSADPEVAITAYSLAAVLREEGAAAAAVPLYREAAAIDRKASGPGEELARDLGSIAACLQETGRIAEAEDNFRQALAMRQAAKGPDDADVLVLTAKLGDLLTDAGRFAEAEALLRKVLTRRRAVLQPGHWLTYSAERLVGRCLVAQRRYAEAESLLVDSYEGLQRDPAADPKAATQTAESLVQLYTAWGKRPQAAAWSRKLPRTP